MQRMLAIMMSIGLGTQASAQGLTERFLSRNDEPVSSYLAVRRLEARNQRFKVDGWLEACVELSAGSQLTWRITREGGSGYIRSKVLRKALEGERKALAQGDPARAVLSTENYTISAGPPAGATGVAQLELVPKRNDVLLIRGRALVSDPEADLLEVTGQLAKSPSFWTRNVAVVRRYLRIGGVRVPVETTSTADVRIAGTSHFRMTARYISINGQPLGTGDEATAECDGRNLAVVTAR
jgi:hypothetical protein